MVYTKWMIDNAKNLSDCKAGDIVWVSNGDGFERIGIVGPGLRKDYISYYKDDGKLYYTNGCCQCWYENPNPVNPRMKQLTTEDLLNIFWFFDKHGLIKEDLAFDPEHFMETVAKEHLPNFDYHEKEK